MAGSLWIFYIGNYEATKFATGAEGSLLSYGNGGSPHVGLIYTEMTGQPTQGAGVLDLSHGSVRHAVPGYVRCLRRTTIATQVNDPVPIKHFESDYIFTCKLDDAEQVIADVVNHSFADGIRRPQAVIADAMAAPASSVSSHCVGSQRT